MENRPVPRSEEGEDGSQRLHPEVGWADMHVILFRLRIVQNFPERLGTRKTGDRHSRGWSMVRSTTPRACNAATSVAMPRFMRDDMRGGETDDASGTGIG